MFPATGSTNTHAAPSISRSTASRSLYVTTRPSPRASIPSVRTPEPASERNGSACPW